MKRTFFTYIILAIIFIFIGFMMLGCTKVPDATEAASNAAHQQVEAIRESLPEACKTKAIQKQLESTDFAIEAVVSNCEEQKQALNAEKKLWEMLFFLLSAIVLFHIARKVIK